MTNRDEQYWRGLMRLSISLEDACTECELIFQKGVLPAMDPSGHPKKVGVECTPVPTTTHILFKDKKSTSRNQLLRERVQEQFRASHGERVHWIPEVLTHPDQVGKSPAPGKGQPASFLYICKTVPHERFVCVVKKFGMRYWLATAFDVDMNNAQDKDWWDRYLSSYRIEVHK